MQFSGNEGNLTPSHCPRNPWTDGHYISHRWRCLGPLPLNIAWLRSVLDSRLNLSRFQSVAWSQTLERRVGGTTSVDVDDERRRRQTARSDTLCISWGKHDVDRPFRQRKTSTESSNSIRCSILSQCSSWSWQSLILSAIQTYLLNYSHTVFIK